MKQQQLLLRFIDVEPCRPTEDGGEFEQLLAEIMGRVDVRRLQHVYPQRLRQLLLATFEVLRARHLRDNDFLSPAQFESRVREVRDALNVTTG